MEQGLRRRRRAAGPTPWLAPFVLLLPRLCAVGANTAEEYIFAGCNCLSQLPEAGARELQGTWWNCTMVEKTTCANLSSRRKCMREGDAALEAVGANSSSRTCTWFDPRICTAPPPSTASSRKFGSLRLGCPNEVECAEQGWAGDCTIAPEHLAARFWGTLSWIINQP
mmetsp:Transcript_92996/g.300547  ORF Transcript_92996/g.300547 Transcript_92996/m.300547 type:complete len:168 (-) Transcript_92996:158-661(-)